MASELEKRLQELVEAERQRNGSAAREAVLPDLTPEMLLSAGAVREMRAVQSSQFASTFGRPKMPTYEPLAEVEASQAQVPFEVEFTTFAADDINIDFTPNIESVANALSQATQRVTAAIVEQHDARAIAIANRAARLQQAGVSTSTSTDDDWELGGDANFADDLASVPSPDLSSLFMNREALQAQEALGAGSPFQLPMPDIDIDDSPNYGRRYGGSFGGGGTVVSQRGEDGRFHATGTRVAAVRPIRAVEPPTRPASTPRRPEPPARRPAPPEPPRGPAPTAFSRLGRDFDDF